jgi:hypothetical protein
VQYRRSAARGSASAAGVIAIGLPSGIAMALLLWRQFFWRHCQFLRPARQRRGTPRITSLADSPMTSEVACGQNSCGETRWRRPHVDSRWSFYYWIDDFAGDFGTVVILGAMLAGSLYWLLGSR